MKKEKNKDFTKLTREGISLIVLIITIIVVIILAAVVILTISKNNPLKSAKEATFKEDVRNFQSDLLLTISKQYTESQGNRDLKITIWSIPTTFEEMKNYIPNYNQKYDKKLGIEDDEIVYFPDEVTADEKKWLEDLGIKPWGKDIEEASVDIFRWDPNDDTKIIGYNAEPLKEYLLRNKNVLRIPEKCTSIGKSAFNGCDSLVSVILPNGVKGIEDNSFMSCTNLINITIPNSVTSIGASAFLGCSGLTSIVLPDSITNIWGQTFMGCINLNNIIIPNSVVRLYDRAFYGCSSLTSITIPDSVTYIGSDTFAHCTNLTNVKLGNSVTTIGSSAFRDCTSLKDITMPYSVTSIGGGAFDDTLWYKNKEDGLVYINNILYKYKGEMPKNTIITIKDGTKKITGNAFCGCINLAGIIIPDSVTSIGDDVFSGCTSLTNITIPDSVKSIGWSVFYNCTSLTNITIPDGITRINNYAFVGCSSLVSINVPNSVKYIGWYAFLSCTSLTNITFNGTVNEWNNITKSSDWKDNSSIQTITCTDGIINL